MKAVIVCNGSIRDFSYLKRYFEGAGLVICADGGAKHLRAFEIKPDILLGDFDSISEEDYSFFKECGTEIVTFPSEKDMTDTEIAVELAMNRGCNAITLIGGIGTRLDHSFANVFLLKKMLDNNIKGSVVDEYNEITLINDRIKLEKEKNIKVSLLPLTGTVTGVTTKGLYFPLKEATIEMGSSWGVSNEFSEDIAEVIISDGLMLVIKSRD